MTLPDDHNKDEEEDREACPGCGCLPGDGVTATCNHPSGCDFYHDLAREEKMMNEAQTPNTSNTVTEQPTEQPQRQPDKYDRAIDYLLSLHPADFKRELYDNWNYPCHTEPKRPAGSLFRYVSPSRDSVCEGKYCGCLTQVHARHENAFDEELTLAIRADQRIPDNITDLAQTREALEPFADWQRKFDEKWGVVD